MILACPSCKTSFKVPEGAITAEGRKVRCASCAHVWHATLKDIKPATPPRQAQRPAMPQSPPQPRPAQPSELDHPQAALQRTARPASNPMPPAMPADQARAQTEAIRQAMLAEAGVEDTVEDPPYSEAVTEQSSNDQQSDLGALLEGANEHTEDANAEFDVSVLDEASGEEGPSLSTDELMEKYLGGEDDDPIMQHRMRQKKEYERKVARRKSIVKNFFIWTMLLAWVVGVAGFFFVPRETIMAWWPASKVIYDKMDSGGDTTALEEQLKDELAKDGLTLSPKPSDVQQGLFVEDPQTEYVERDGQSFLKITGRIQNNGDYAITVPAFEAQVRDLNRVVIKSWRFEVKGEGRILSRGGRMEYETISPWPVPDNANSLAVKPLFGDQGGS
ncbi:zinc-ribbon domain-containing protein [Temperatibacter marinus]|uniref:Zinc-ribbon domain-containing protein n=1 Tax=Temperatibacter marinus TaxID=1456591 RepID=A0AA52EEG3_9PROT|nr:zinc-ribbon domain-containing protein [Temperatibacter marinus]WND03977.1 zinc-ribbon domain-containing protein [Temperatibacter marinus]